MTVRCDVPSCPNARGTSAEHQRQPGCPYWPGEPYDRDMPPDVSTPAPETPTSAVHQVAVQAIANTAAEPATWGVAGVVELAPGESCENVLPGLEQLEGSEWIALPQWRAEAWPPDPALGNFLGAFATVQVPLAGRAVVRLVLVVLGGRAVPLVVSASILPVPALPQRSARSVGRSVADAVVSAAAAAAPRG